MALPLCVVTGAADGIGRALLLHAARSGWSVAGIDRDAVRLAEVGTLCAALQVPWVAIEADLASAAAREHVISELKQLPPAQLWIHNAGISAVGRFSAVDLPSQQAVLDVNLEAPLHLTKCLFEAALLTEQASLVFIASLSHYAGYPGASVYAATKSGLAAYARSLTWAKPKLHVLTVLPGPTRTAHARRYSPDNSREARRMAPEQLANAIFVAIQARQRILIPGASAKAAALLGKLFPRLSDALMKKIMLR